MNVGLGVRGSENCGGWVGVGCEIGVDKKKGFEVSVCPKENGVFTVLVVVPKELIDVGMSKFGGVIFRVVVDGNSG